MKNKPMRYILFILLALLTGCKEKPLSPVGKEYILTDSNVPMAVTLGFNPDGRFYGKAVNKYWGQYHIYDNVISFSGITSTMRSDILPRMQAERKYFDSLANGYNFEIQKEGLKIFFDEAGILEFKLKTESSPTPLAH